MPAAPPVVAPTIINTGDTGGGSEGLLKMQWQVKTTHIDLIDDNNMYIKT